jgi:hypothetical protein
VADPVAAVYRDRGFYRKRVDRLTVIDPTS